MSVGRLAQEASVCIAQMLLPAYIKSEVCENFIFSGGPQVKVSVQKNMLETAGQKRLISFTETIL